jgi:ribosomal protein S21
MALNVKKREGESTNTLIYRFGKKIQQGGILREAKKRRFHERNINRNVRRRSALHRDRRKQEIEKSKKMGEFFR